MPHWPEAHITTSQDGIPLICSLGCSPAVYGKLCFVCVWACCGQLQDPDEQGIAHMMEHVCFLGSRKRCGLWVLVANVRVLSLRQKVVNSWLGNYSPVLVLRCLLPYCSIVMVNPSREDPIKPLLEVND